MEWVIEGKTLTSFLLVIVAIILLFCTIVIGANNSGIVVLDYFWGTQSFTLSVLLAMSFIVGVALASVVWGMYSLKLKLKVSSLERQRKKLNKESVN